MPTSTYTFKKTNLFKRAFLATTGALLFALVSGAAYVENEPALSLRALFADAEGIFFSVAWRPLLSEQHDSATVARGIPVLTYHRLVSDLRDVNNVTVSNFRDQMLALKKAGWQTISLKEFEEFIQGQKTLPEKSFLLTFDDAAKESFYPVDPVLKALQYEAATFVIVASSRIPDTTYYLSEKELADMVASGRWDIGSHSFDGHRPYIADAADNTGVFFADRIWLHDVQRLETPEEFRMRVSSDLRRAKIELETTYKIPMNSFAFPLGNETGVAGANNFPEGASTTEAIARSIYKFGFLQLNNQQFTLNFPSCASSYEEIASRTACLLGNDFVARRIHVDHDWDGARLLSIMENARIKQIPYEDDFSQDNGWITAWGQTDMGRNNFTLSASAEDRSSEAFLDGSALWDEYTFDVSANWQNGHLFVLADLVNSSTYDACVFADGQVSIHASTDGTTHVLATKSIPNITYSDTARAGIRVHGSTIECTWNYSSVLEAYSRSHSGGIGLQVWSNVDGTAQAQFTSLIVRPYASSTQQTAQ